MTNPKLKKIKELASIVNGTLSRDEFFDLFKKVIEFVRELEPKLLNKLEPKLFNKIDLMVADKENQLLSYFENELNKILKEYSKGDKKSFKKLKSAMTKLTDNVINKVNKKLIEVKNGRDGEPGPEGPQGPQGKPGKDGDNFDAEEFDRLRNEMYETIAEEMRKHKRRGGVIGDSGIKQAMQRLDTYVPYTGATTDIDLGSYNIQTTGSITIDQINIENNVITTVGQNLTLDTGGTAMIFTHLSNKKFEILADQMSFQDQVLIDDTSTEAFLVRKNNDGGDVLIVDTTNSKVGIGVAPTYALTVIGDIYASGSYLMANGQSLAWGDSSTKITGNSSTDVMTLTAGANVVTVAELKAAYDHVSSNGTDHTYIDQDVTTTGTPEFASIKLTPADDPDLSTAGELSWDANEEAIRGYSDDNSAQVVMNQVKKTITFSVQSPDKIGTHAGRSTQSFCVWQNDTGFTFNITRIFLMSDTENYGCELYKSSSETDVSTGNDTLIDELSAGSSGTSCYYDEETSFSSSTIETGKWLIFEHVEIVAKTITINVEGYFDADVN